MTGRKRTAGELRALWRKAIMEQILLIRMEKENKSLQGRKENELDSFGELKMFQFKSLL